MQESIELPDFLGIAFAEIGDDLNGPNWDALLSDVLQMNWPNNL
jgi:hypothetical protein